MSPEYKQGRTKGDKDRPCGDKLRGSYTMCWQIIISILGGIIVAVLTSLCIYLRRKGWQCKFKQLFGEDVEGRDKLHLVYGEFILHKEIDNFLRDKRISHPYQKEDPVPNYKNQGFSISKPVSIAEVRAANYLSSVIGSQMKVTPILSSDIYIKDELDLSFISFGGPSGNHKTNDVLINKANQLIRFDQSQNQMTSVRSGRPILTTASLTSEYNYGLILKIRPKQFPNRVWIICAGFNEWGTSGAAWYLAHKWKRIHKWAKGSKLGIIVKVRNEQDESAEEFGKAKTPEEAEALADKVNTSAG